MADEKKDVSMEETIGGVTVNQENEKTSDETKVSSIDTQNNGKEEAYFKTLGMKYGKKNLDQREAKPFMVDPSGFITLGMFDNLIIRFKLLNGEGISKISDCIDSIKTNINKIINMFKLGDTYIEDIEVPHDIELNKNYKFLRIRLPYVTKTEQIHNAIKEVLKNNKIEDVIEFRFVTSDMLELYINDTKENSNSVFCKGYTALGYTDYNNYSNEPYINSETLIESNIGFDRKDIANINSGALVINKLNIYNDPKYNFIYKPVTIQYRKRCSVIVYEIDDVTNDGKYMVTRYIVRAGINKNKYEKEGKFSFNYSGYIFDYKKDRIAVKTINDIFYDENGEFIMSKLIGAPAPKDSVKLNQFENDLNFINSNIFENLEFEIEEDDESSKEE